MSKQSVLNREIAERLVAIRELCEMSALDLAKAIHMDLSHIHIWFSSWRRSKFSTNPIKWCGYSNKSCCASRRRTENSPTGSRS